MVIAADVHVVVRCDDGPAVLIEGRRAPVVQNAVDADGGDVARVFGIEIEDVDLANVASAVRTPEQGAELYLAARLAIDPDEPGERSYLDALAARLQIPSELRASLEQAAPAARS